MNTKKILFALFCTAFVFQSCDSDDYQPKEVEFRIDYSFSSGSMSRSTNDEIYTKFYEDNIKTRKITPNNYSIVFTNKETGQKNEINGLWSEKNLIRLAGGTYTITGSSEDDGKSSEVKEKVIIEFKDEIVINENTSTLILKAQYNCSLLLFDASLSRDVTYYWEYPYGESLKSLNGYFYCFCKRNVGGKESYFGVMRTNGKVSKVHTDNLNLENGKYYFFNDMTGGFDLEPMTPGN